MGQTKKDDLRIDRLRVLNERIFIIFTLHFFVHQNVKFHRYFDGILGDFIICPSKYHQNNDEISRFAE